MLTPGAAGAPALILRYGIAYLAAACEPSEESVLQIWFQEDFRNYWDACPWEEDLAVCQQVSPYTYGIDTLRSNRGTATPQRCANLACCKGYLDLLKELSE